MFIPERQQIGVENKTAFSIFGPFDRTWAAVVDGVVTITKEPPRADRAIFDEERAWDVLEASRKLDPTLANYVVVGHDVEAPVFRDTGIEIEELRSKDVNFHVRGPAADVDAWVARYLNDFPKSFYDTTASPHIETDGIKTVRVFRRRSAKGAF